MPVEVSGIKLNRVHKIVTLEQGAFVYHHIPGLEGNVVQDLGRDSVRLQIEGIFYGPEAQDGLEGLREVYKARQPVDFLAEVIGQAYFGQVILERFEVSQLAGEPDQFSYRLVVTEYVKPPEPATAAAASVEQAIKLDADTFMEMATLPDMLSLGAVPELTNPVVPLTGALDPIAAAVEALQSATEALTRLFEQDGDGGTPPDIPPEWGAHPPTPLDWGPSPDGRDGQPIGLNGQPLGADGALRDRDGQPLLGPHGELLGPDGRPLLGPNGELLGPDGQPLRGPHGELLGAQGELLGLDGEPVLGPHGELLDADGNPLLGPDGELLGPDGQALLDEDGQPLGPDGQPIDIARLTIALLNEASEPMPGAAYALTLDAEEIERGWLNMQGQVQIKGLKTETDYTLTLADFDGLEAVTVQTGWVVIALTDEASTPVAGVWYVLSLANGSTREGTLDAMGQAALAGLEPGLTYRLSFPDYALTAWGLAEEMRPPTVQAGWVVITLLEEAGAPVPGAAYVLSLADGSTREGMLDATGHAALTDLAPGLAYRLSFPAYNLTAWGRVEELPRPVPQLGRVAIMLVDEAGDPVPGVRYVFTLADGNTQEGWSDATGQAVLTGLEPGLVYRLTFPDHDHRTWSSLDEGQAEAARPGWVALALVDKTGTSMAGAVYVLTLADGSAREGTLDADGQAVIAALEPGVVYSLSFLDYDHTTWGQVEERTPPPSLPSWVTIVLVDEAGAPVAEAVYVLTLADGSTHTGVLGATGEVVLTELAGGVAYSLSFPEYDVTVWASIEEIQAPTTLAGWVQVALVDEAGVPGAGAVYVLTLVDGSTQEGWLDAAGQAVITDLEPGIAYHLSFPDYDVTAWRQVEERQVVAPSSGWVRLALVDEEDVPVVEATYVLTLANGSTRTGALDADGQAVVADLEPGIVYYLSFPTYDRTAWERVDAVRTAESRPGWVAMTLVDEAGTPMAGAAYVLTLEDGNSREDALDAAGQVLLEDLEPGQAYRLSFPQVAATAWGRDDGQAPATPPGWIAMTLADEDGMPMAGAAYVLTLADGSTSEGWLDVAGQAVLVGLEPGEVYCLSFPAYDGADWDLVRG